MNLAENALEKEARENIYNRFLQGDKVGRFTIRDLLDCELSGMNTYEFRFCEIIGILDADPLEREAKIDKLYSGLIDRHLDSHPDLISDEMNALEEETHAVS